MHAAEQNGTLHTAGHHNRWLLGGGRVGFRFRSPVPSLVISVLFACALAALLYSILGSVGEAGFKLGPINVGGSAAVLIGGIYLFNILLEPQLAAIRYRSLKEELEGVRFVFDLHATPAEGGSRSISRPARR